MIGKSSKRELTRKKTQFKDSQFFKETPSSTIKIFQSESTHNKVKIDVNFFIFPIIILNSI